MQSSNRILPTSYAEFEENFTHASPIVISAYAKALFPLRPAEDYRIAAGIASIKFFPAFLFIAVTAEP
jgi:hypothetical protein